jgi:hypothetical protein
VVWRSDEGKLRMHGGTFGELPESEGPTMCECVLPTAGVGGNSRRTGYRIAPIYISSFPAEGKVINRLIS